MKLLNKNEKGLKKLASTKQIIRNMILVLSIVLLLPTVLADLKLDNIYFDPAIIAAGDEVDVVIQFSQTITGIDENKVNNPDYKFNVEIIPDDTLTEKFVTIQDAKGDDVSGTILSGDYYNKKFRIKVNNNAPAGNYEFKLVGRWYFKGQPEEASQFLRFLMPVKKEGILLDIGSIETVPSEVRSGDNFVKLVSRVENVGEKDAKSVELSLNLPKGLEASYTNNNRIWVGKVNAGESKEATFFVDVQEKAESKIYNIRYDFDYMDIDNNEYTKSTFIPFLVKPRPYLEVIKVNSEGLTGKSAKLEITIKNTGSESAESIDVRLLKQNSQPFTLDVRSDYIGELQPGEQGKAIFNIKVNRNAEIKDHDFQLLIRSKGDSDQGDDNIYTYNRRAKFPVTGNAPNTLKIIGLIIAGIIILAIIFSRIKKKGGKKK